MSARAAASGALRAREPGRVRWLWAPALALALGAAAGRADVVHVPADRDNTLFQDADGDTSNGSGPAFFAGNNAQNRVDRALVRFDIAGSLPSGGTVDSVRLTLQVSSAPNSTLRTFTLHRALADWGEGASYSTGGTGAPAAPGDATWLYRFFPDSPWSAPGGDFADFVSAAQQVGGVGTWTWSGAGMLDDVRFWHFNPSANFGWLLQGDESGPSTVRKFSSREAVAPALPPDLVIWYTPATDAVTGQPAAGLRLGPARPNPSAGPVRIALTVPTHCVAHVVLYDAGGREVARLLDGGLTPGTHDLAWDGRDARGRRAAPGVYVCRAIVNGRVLPPRRLAVIR